MAAMAPPSPRSTEESPEPEGTARKRRRTAIACEECRERKRKCDGVKPVCGACTRRQAGVCVWNEERNSKGWWSNSYVESLRARINELETSRGGAQDVAQGAEHFAFGNGGETPAGLQTTYVHRPPPAVLSEPALAPVAEEPAHHSAMSFFPPAQTTADPGFRSTMYASAQAPMGTFEASSVHSGTSHVGAGPGHESDQDDSEAEMDAMGVPGSINGVNRLRARRPSDYFGPSSTVSLLGKARNAMSRRRCPHRSPNDMGSGPCQRCQQGNHSFTGPSPRTAHAHSPSAQNSHAAFSFMVPPRAEADGLIESYWASVHSLYPFLHRPSFLKRYRTVWDGGQEHMGGYYATLDGTGFYCMLNVVFALGALFNPSIDEKSREKVSRSFFDRSKQLLDLDRLEHGSVALVQTLLLMGQYLQSTDMSSSCWNIVGLAIRVAQCIGLHYEPKGPQRGVDQIEVEMRRRAWTGCVLLDRVLSLAYGRPLMIHPAMTRNQLVLPLAADDEYLTHYPEPPGAQPDGEISLIECYIQSIKLQEILGQVLASFYYGGDSEGGRKEFDAFDPGSSGTATPVKERGIHDSDLQRLLDVDRMLTAWHKKLPPHLRVQAYASPQVSSSDPGRRLVFRRQATVLEARYLHVRLIMLRPVLSVLCDLASETNADASDDDMGSNMRHGMLIRLANMCVMVAQEIVQLITRSTKTETDSLPAPWYSVFYIHSCALVLVIGILCAPRYIDCADEPSLFADWRSCVDFLRMYRQRSRSARRCSKMLEILEREMSTYRSGLPWNATTANKEPSILAAAATGFAADMSTVDGSSGQSAYSDDLNSLQLMQDFTPFDQGGAPWMQNSSDMTWLSLVPFLEPMEETNL